MERGGMVLCYFHQTLFCQLLQSFCPVLRFQIIKMMTINKFFWIGLVLATLPISTLTPAALADVADISDFTRGSMQFENRDYFLDVNRGDRGYRYSLRNKKGKELLVLYGGRLTKTGEKHYYRWNNKGVLCQVTWNLKDQDYARVQYFDRGRPVFNQLFKALDAS
jgi:hypothetical protein